MKTNAARILDSLGIPYELRDYDPGDEHLTAETVAQQVGLPPEQVFKTLVARGDRHGVCFAVVPGDAELDLKALAKLTGDRKVDTVPLKEVQPLTGYVRGGVTVARGEEGLSGLRRRDDRAVRRRLRLRGVRGTQILVAPADYLRATKGARWPDRASRSRRGRAASGSVARRRLALPGAPLAGDGAPDRRVRRGVVVRQAALHFARTPSDHQSLRIHRHRRVPICACSSSSTFMPTADLPRQRALDRPAHFAGSARVHDRAQRVFERMRPAVAPESRCPPEADTSRRPSTCAPTSACDRPAIARLRLAFGSPYEAAPHLFGRHRADARPRDRLHVRREPLFEPDVPTRERREREVSHLVREHPVGGMTTPSSRPPTSSRIDAPPLAERLPRHVVVRSPDHDRAAPVRTGKRAVKASTARSARVTHRRSRRRLSASFPGRWRPDEVQPP